MRPTLAVAGSVGQVCRVIPLGGGVVCYYFSSVLVVCAACEEALYRNPSRDIVCNATYTLNKSHIEQVNVERGISKVMPRTH